ncbi:MAG TPA: L,D-transpeptidase family protein [Allosphingosinicella sp.]|jgi:lipoprotein-anchoring transpeptidase ErfK/SrfK
MNRLWLFVPVSLLVLGSAAPPPLRSAAPAPRVEAAPDFDHLFALSAGEALPPVAPAPASPVEVAQAPPPPKPPKVKKDAASQWAPKRDGIEVVVSIPQQKAYVFEGGRLVASSPVSTGKRGHETPAGTFRILQKKVHHRSSKYDNAPMPYMQRLTNYGIALHAGALPGYPASHGCIRLPRSFARKLYNMTDMGTRVVVTKTALAATELRPRRKPEPASRAAVNLRNPTRKAV